MFDPHRPPDQGLIDVCVHCGFCLPTCPTYVLWGEEMDSPRGRIVLMKHGLEAGSDVSEMAVHFDRCLGCMACVTACPSGVQYDRLIEATRPQVERNVRRPLADRLFRRFLFATFTIRADCERSLPRWRFIGGSERDGWLALGSRGSRASERWRGWYLPHASGTL